MDSILSALRFDDMWDIKRVEAPDGQTLRIFNNKLHNALEVEVHGETLVFHSQADLDRFLERE